MRRRAACSCGVHQRTWLMVVGMAGMSKPRLDRMCQSGRVLSARSRARHCCTVATMRSFVFKMFTALVFTVCLLFCGEKHSYAYFSVSVPNNQELCGRVSLLFFYG